MNLKFNSRQPDGQQPRPFLEWRELALLRRALVMALSLQLTACATFDFSGPARPAVLSSSRNTAFSYTAEDQGRAPYFRTEYATSGNKKEIRNEIIYDLMGLIDANYEDYEQRFRNARQTKDFTAVISSLGLTSAATFIGSSQAARVMTAIATGITSANGVVDKELFRQQSIEVLIAQMQALRGEVSQQVTRKMGTSTTEYPLSAALRDITRYYYAGSIEKAMQANLTQAQRKAEAQQADAANSTPSNPVTDAVNANADLEVAKTRADSMVKLGGRTTSDPVKSRTATGGPSKLSKWEYTLDRTADKVFILSEERALAIAKSELKLEGKTVKEAKNAIHKSITDMKSTENEVNKAKVKRWDELLTQN